MTNLKATRRALLGSVIALILCFSMLLGTTLAWFSDSVTSVNNVITAGNLKVKFEWTQGINDPRTATYIDVEAQNTNVIYGADVLWEPGYVDAKHFKITNLGNLALKYQLRIIPNSADAEYLKLAEVIDVYFVGDATAAVTSRTALSSMTRIGTLAEVMTKINGSALGFGDLKGVVANSEPDCDIVTIVLKMQETAGNEYQGLSLGNGFTIQLIAMQDTVENDAFDNQYDADADLVATGNGVFVDGKYEAVARTGVGSKLGVAYTKNVAGAANEFSLTIEKLSAAQLEYPNGNKIVLSDGQDAVTYNVEVSGQKAGEEVEVWLRVEDPSKVVALYHNDTSIDFTRTGGEYIVFKSTSFSPFTVVTGTPVIQETDKPQATVVDRDDFENVELEWGNYGGLKPDLTVDPDPKLEAAYSFSLSETVEEAKNGQYADWYCDFYVSLDRALGENQILLAGNYGNFGWIGFHNGEYELEANTSVGLLATFLGTEQSGWTYAMVADLVGEFLCGVGDVNNALSGATFTVELRLTNPENPNDIIVAAKVPYTFN